MAQAEYRPAVSQYTQAFRSIRCAKNLFFYVVLLSILVELTGFVLLTFTGTLDAGYRPVAAVAPATPPATSAPAAGADTLAARQAAESWKLRLGMAMAAAKFFAPVAAALLTITLLVGVLISLVGRLEGAANLLGATFWSLGLLAVLAPWQQIFPGVGAGAMYSLGELVRHAGQALKAWGGTAAGAFDVVLYYARTAAYPAVALLIWAMVQVKFCRAYRGMVAATTALEDAQGQQAGGGLEL